ncbi:putative peptide ABC transporter, permease protein [Devosia sp. LC5]|uniref:ABC transporter permease n=1 Tax=Devosia sp. LC5 TaxID=1502724 RepID=UPI0004E36BB8|nr:ABC transporter permease [Devosia sp. LC5]KFC67192.1 putative peptide ABC transporter, permease protein [Devosia sp. LC5]
MSDPAQTIAPAKPLRPRTTNLKLWVAIGTLLTFIVIAAGSRLLQIDPGPIDTSLIYAPPSAAHWLGFDDAGRDVVRLLIIGSWPSVIVGLCAAAVAVLIGGTIGLVAGYSRGWLDLILLRITDYFIVVPALPLAMVITAIWGADLWRMIVVIGILLWATTARVVRAQVKSGRERVYVQRAKALGAGPVHIIIHHILPQVLPLISTTGALAVALAILTQAALEFFGLGGADVLSWGTMIRFAFQRDALLNDAWWVIVPPGLCICTVITACYWLSQCLESAINPRLHTTDLRVRSFSRRLTPGDQP